MLNWSVHTATYSIGYDIHTHNGGIFARSPKHSKVRKETRLQLWCELFPWALGIINQPLQYRGHEEVAVVTKVLKEAER